jgi:hypothetical protein
MLAVKAGFIFNGDEKNCEKLGSCACKDFITIINTMVTVTVVLLIVFMTRNLAY